MVKQLSPVSWEAEEYITKDHNTGWYIGLALVTIALSALAILLQGWTFLILIIISVITVLIFSLENLPPARKPFFTRLSGLQLLVLLILL